MGLEGRKIGAIAVNSIVMVSQMVRSAIDKITNYMKEKMVDWIVIVKAIEQEIIKNQTNPNSIPVLVNKMI